ncbi:hypothetical protein HXX76_001910 [Chlamydomonas incerta]|uniref:Uncharacterized protein n=1 Tax=Chlamydomonas incerta TaxID=51695 RepID=A0A836B099_CHLIN|nr:hypothetical protein HXX76_001910 [Chlamydomonas incerta]|eukprot:KAG2443558.1 hypothetical protein HXX76_001910 [Chlamydomonas incerta]
MPSSPQPEGAEAAGGRTDRVAPACQPTAGRRRRVEAVPVLEPHDLFLAQLLASPQSPAPTAPASRRQPGTAGSSIWTWGRTLAGLGHRRKLWGAAADVVDAEGAGGAASLDAAGSVAEAAPAGLADPIEDLLPRFGSEAVLSKPRSGNAGQQPGRARREGGAGDMGLAARAASMSSAHAGAAADLALQRQLHAAAGSRGRPVVGHEGSLVSQHPLLERAQHEAKPQQSWPGWSFRAPQRFAALVGAGTEPQYDLDVLRELEQGWSSQCAMQ